ENPMFSSHSEEEAADHLATQLGYLGSSPPHPIFPDVSTAAARLRQAAPALSHEQALSMAIRITETCDGGVRWRWDPRLRTRAGLSLSGMNNERYLKLLSRIQAPTLVI